MACTAGTPRQEDPAFKGVASGPGGSTCRESREQALATALARFGEPSPTTLDTLREKFWVDPEDPQRYRGVALIEETQRFFDEDYYWRVSNDSFVLHLRRFYSESKHEAPKDYGAEELEAFVEDDVLWRNALPDGFDASAQWRAMEDAPRTSFSSDVRALCLWLEHAYNLALRGHDSVTLYAGTVLYMDKAMDGLGAYHEDAEYLLATLVLGSRQVSGTEATEAIYDEMSTLEARPRVQSARGQALLFNGSDSGSSGRRGITHRSRFSPAGYERLVLRCAFAAGERSAAFF